LQTFYNWRNNPMSTQSQNYLKHNFIIKAGKLFSLSFDEIEKLANKAGLSLNNNIFKDKYKINMVSLNTEFSDELFPDISKIVVKSKMKEKIINKEFAVHFSYLLSKYKGTKTDLYRAALVSEKMFYYMKSGKNIRKEPILALLIAMELDLAEIQIALSKAGFILSKSLINDMVIMWVLEHKVHNKKGSQRLFIINEILDELGFPLLMTRAKEDKHL